MFDIISEHQAMALVGLFGGVLLGLAARLGRFCTLGAIEDALYGGSLIRMRMWGVATGTTIFCTFLLIGNGVIDIAAIRLMTIAWNPLASIAGGLVFGYGMALAGNCGYGAIARLGGGDLRSFVIVLVMGVAAFVVLSGPLATLRETVFIAPPANGAVPPGIAQTLNHLTGLPTTAIGLTIGAAVFVLSASASAFWTKPKNVLWSLAVGLAVTSGWAGSAIIAQNGFEPTPLQSHSFAAPLGETILWWMTGSARPISFAVGSIAGVWIGAFVGSLIKGHFRWEACDDPRELRRQIIGAALMGGGAVVAIGCSVGQGLSAMSILSLSAPVTLAAIFAGAAIGLRQLIVGFQLVQ